MPRHLAACPKRRAAIENAERRKDPRQALYHLRVRDARRGEFWLDLEVPGTASLATLDSYLRAIWLECCGHLSMFSVGGWRGAEIPMKRSIAAVFRPGVELTHIYDFGTSSHTLIKLVRTREGRPTTNRPVALMARNLMPDVQCAQCEEPAAWLCMECMIEEDEPGMLCDQHAKTHAHHDYGEPIKRVNSPRLGMCGYTGPARPPY
jgi:hypothetical protein